MASEHLDVALVLLSGIWKPLDCANCAKMLLILCAAYRREQKLR